MKNLLDQLQQLAPLAAAATAGPWHASEEYDFVTAECGLYFVNSDPVASEINAKCVEDWANAAFIAAARNVLTPANVALLVAALEGNGHV